MTRKRLLLGSIAAIFAAGFAGLVYADSVTLTSPATATANITSTSTSANALVVGPNGATNPTFNVDASAASAITGLNVAGAATGAGVAVTALGSTNEPMFIAGKGTGQVNIGGTTTTTAGLQVVQTASRVNDVIVTPGATGAIPIIASGGAGADSNIGLAINATGTGSVFLSGSTAANAGASVAHGTANVNQIVLTGTNTGTAPTITTGGSGGDANVNLAVKGSGTGIVTLGSTGGANGLSCTDSGNGARTCNGQRGIATFTTTTIAGVTDSAQTINNTSVTANSLVVCWLSSFSGTLVTNGIPVVTVCTPGSSAITVHITNVHATQTTGSQSFGVGFVVLN